MGGGAQGGDLTSLFKCMCLRGRGFVYKEEEEQDLFCEFFNFLI